MRLKSAVLTILAVLATFILYSSSAQAAVSCSKLGNKTFCSDGSSSTRIGNKTFNSDGSSSTRIGNKIFGSNGTSCSVIGNKVFCN